MKPFHLFIGLPFIELVHNQSGLAWPLVSVSIQSEPMCFYGDNKPAIWSAPKYSIELEMISDDIDAIRPFQVLVCLSAAGLSTATCDLYLIDDDIAIERLP